MIHQLNIITGLDKVETLPRRAKDYTGIQSGKIMALYPVRVSGKLHWVCECACGNKIIIKGKDILKTYSCGCEPRVSLTGKNNPMYKHGAVGTRLYSIHTGMLKRCRQPSTRGYKNYGGRGIVVCDEWKGKHGFENFHDWATRNGYKDGLTLDRIDNDGNYSPDNCKWSTVEEQCNNRRNNVWVEYDGERHTLAQWARILNVPSGTIKARHRRGWSDAEILFGKK